MLIALHITTSCRLPFALPSTCQSPSTFLPCCQAINYPLHHRLTVELSITLHITALPLSCRSTSSLPPRHQVLVICPPPCCLAIESLISLHIATLPLSSQSPPSELLPCRQVADCPLHCCLAAELSITLPIGALCIASELLSMLHKLSAALRFSSAICIPSSSHRITIAPSIAQAFVLLSCPPSIKQSIDQENHRSSSPSIEQSIDQAVHQSSSPWIDQSTNRAVHQSSHKSTEHPLHYCCCKCAP